MCLDMVRNRRPIVRTRILRALDEILSSGHLDLLLARLTAEGDTVKVLEDIAPRSLRAAHYETLRRDWFQPTSAWWRDVPGCAGAHQVLQHGLLHAVRAAKSAGWPPVVSYWVRMPNQFQVIADASPQQLTIFFVTPDPQATTL